MGKIFQSLRGVVQQTLHRSETNSVVFAKGINAASLNDAMEELEKILADRIGRLKAACRRKDVAGQRMEATLSTQIHDLQIAVKEKDEALKSRDSEVNGLKSKIDGLVKQLTELELAIQQAKGEAASEAQRAENVTESSKAKIATLEAQLRQAESIVRGKDWTMKELEKNLTAKIQELESQVTDKEKLPAD